MLTERCALHTEDVRFPFPLDYLGSKNRIRKWILNAVSEEFPRETNFVDVMSGSASVSHEANLKGYDIYCNDLQSYAATIAKSAFHCDRRGLPNLIRILQKLQDSWLQELREFTRFTDIFDDERELIGRNAGGKDVSSSFREFQITNLGDPTSATKKYDLFQAYYTNTYFGAIQCAEIDYLRRFFDNAETADLSTIGRAATISAMVKASNSTTHLAQYLKANTPVQVRRVIEKRSISILPIVVQCLKDLQKYPQPEISEVSQGDYSKLISALGDRGISGVVYADPPYFKEHYSRYYHVLETFDKYDYPELTFNPRIRDITIGRYRKERETSNFGLKSKANEEFGKLLASSINTGGKVAISYAETSLVNLDSIINLANEIGYHTKVYTTHIQHSGQGNKNSTRNVKEYLLVGRIK